MQPSASGLVLAANMLLKERASKRKRFAHREVMFYCSYKRRIHVSKIWIFVAIIQKILYYLINCVLIGWSNYLDTSIAYPRIQTYSNWIYQNIAKHWVSWSAVPLILRSILGDTIANHEVVFTPWTPGRRLGEENRIQDTLLAQDRLLVI